MALQGTIDTFPLTDVLALLASSSRSGRLKLTGDRDSGTVWLHDAAVIGGELHDGRFVNADRILFELLRFQEGSFEFEAIDRSGFPGFEASPKAIVDSVDAAKRMLEEWGAIEALVPTVSHRVDLAPELPSEEFTVDRGLWRVLVTVSRCSSVAEIATELGVDDYEGSALIASMVEAGIVEVGEPWDIDDLLELSRAQDEPTGIIAADITDPEFVKGSSAELALIDELSGLPGDETSSDGPSNDDAGQSFPDHFPIDDLITGEEAEMDDPWSSPAMEKLEEQRRHDAELAESSDIAWSQIDSIPLVAEVSDSDMGAVNGTSFDGWDQLVGTHGEEVDSIADDAADEVLRQMSKLSPKAAEAIAAALGNVEHVAESAPAIEMIESRIPGDSDDSNASETGPISFLDSF